MSNLLVPGEVKLEAQVMRAPNAHPASVTMQSPQGAKVVLIGGLTKLEAGAMQIAAGLAAHGLFETDDVAHRAATIAAQVLKVCEQRELDTASASQLS